MLASSTDSPIHPRNSRSVFGLPRSTRGVQGPMKARSEPGHSKQCLEDLGLGMSWVYLQLLPVPSFVLLSKRKSGTELRHFGRGQSVNRCSGPEKST